jgi:hypothetical protein
MTLEDRVMALPSSLAAAVCFYIDFLESRHRGAQRDEINTAVAALPVEDQLEVVAFLKSRRTVNIRDRAVERRDYWRAAGDRLREVRHQLCLSELDAAQSYGVGVQTYRRYERGSAQRHRMRKLVDFADKYNLSLDWLIEGRGTMFMGGARPAIASASNVVPFPRKGGAA